jgi:putative ABC transport system permease protein
MIAAFLQDVRAALRLMRRHATFSLFVVVMLALGIGAATTVFTLVQAVLLRDLSFADPDRLVWMYNLRTERDRAPLSIPDLNDYQRDATSIEGFAPFTNWTANLTGSGDAERLEGIRVAGNFFQVLGAKASIGRPLQPTDEVTNAKVAVITSGLWKRRFGGDAAAVGRTVTLNGAAHIVVGVMPVGFVFPFRDAEIAVPLPLRDDPRRADRGANFLRVIARLKPGITIARAKADLDTIARRLQTDFPDDDARKIGISLYNLQSEIVADYRQILWTVFAAVGVVLAISCGNLANLLLVRAIGRRSELALRASLGASRSRIVCQLLVEAFVLAAVGGLLGIALARAAIDGWRALGPATFPRMTEIAMDGRVLLFAALVVCGSALTAGLIPAWAASRSLHASLNSETRSHTVTHHQGLVRRGFVMLQVGASAILIVCMSLVARGFARLERVDPGFAPERAMTVQLSLPPTRYATREAIIRFYEALNDRLMALPASQAVGAISLLPLSGLLNTMDVAFPDRPAPPPDEVPQAHFRIASAGYFEAAGIRAIDGRLLSTADTSTSRPVAVVSRTFAERHWPGASAVGKFLRLPIGPAPPSLEVVGVVNDVKQFTLDREPTADLYVPLLQMPATQSAQLVARMYWVVRTRDDPRQLESAVRNAIHAVDPDVATSSSRTLDAILDASLNPRRLNVRFLELFAQVGVALCALGVYAIAAFSVGARRRELAIRAAFGAGRRSLARVVFVDELRPVVVGIVVGLIVAAAGSRLFADLVFAISPTDPTTYLGVGLGLLSVSTLAVYVPARRAGLADPADLLRD